VEALQEIRTLTVYITYLNEARWERLTLLGHFFLFSFPLLLLSSDQTFLFLLSISFFDHISVDSFDTAVETEQESFREIEATSVGEIQSHICVFDPYQFQACRVVRLRYYVCSKILERGRETCICNCSN
jgi:hypothetical protein